MGEYAKFNGNEIKIGTCADMYYLRFADRHRVQALDGNVDPVADAEQLRFRLPFPDEDGVQIRHYEPYRRGVRLWRHDAGDWTSPETADDPGTVQLKHEPSGLLVSARCYHGMRLPEASDDFPHVHWNGKGHSFELTATKVLEGVAHGIVHCRHCGNLWRYPMAELLDWVMDEELRERLASLD
jgi:hypothetical protein